MWSNRCITGNTLGWGITDSSTPQAKTILKELEKLASDIEPDRISGVPVEELIFSPAAGFVRLRAWPFGEGEDQRPNKLVYILSTKDPAERRPCAYFAGSGNWGQGGDDPEKTGLLPEVSYPQCREDPDEILQSMNLGEQLPVFLKAVFWSLLEYHDSLNIIAPGWEREDFPVRSGRLMYALHCLLPENLRKKAGYRSFAWKNISGPAFYFSKEAYGNAAFDLEQDYPPLSESDQDELSVFFFEKITEIIKRDAGEYGELMKDISDYLDEFSGKGHELEKIQWILCDRIAEADSGDQPLSLEYILTHLPDLMYWGREDSALEQVSEHFLVYIRGQELSDEQERLYMASLMDKVAKRTFTPVCKELAWILNRRKEREPGAIGQDLSEIKEKNSTVYKGVRSVLLKEGGWSGEFESDQQDQPVSPKEADRESDRKEEPVMDKSLMKTAEKKDGKMKRHSRSQDAHINEEKENYRVLEEDEGKQEEAGASFLSFLATGIPVGFLTGCVMFVSHYSLMIGHWKIAVGMAGMWLILMLNYVLFLKSTQHKRPLWMGIGLCLLEGELIEIAASYFVIQRFRLLFFIILGVIAAALQLINIIRTERKSRK